MTRGLSAHAVARAVGVDFGERRVGIAIADPLGITVSPYGTFAPDEAIACLVSLKQKHGIEQIVIGWPLELDGSEGLIIDKVRTFVQAVSKKLPGTAIVGWDERYTSKMAERVVFSGARRRNHDNKAAVDRVAAALILQSYLDANPTTRLQQDRLSPQPDRNEMDENSV